MAPCIGPVSINSVKACTEGVFTVVCHIAGNTGIAGGQLAAASRSSNGSPSVGTVAAMAPAPLAAAPEQALKAEVSETASEPELLFAPDFIISQVWTNAERLLYFCQLHVV